MQRIEDAVNGVLEAKDTITKTPKPICKVGLGVFIIIQVKPKKEESE